MREHLITEELNLGKVKSFENTAEGFKIFRRMD